MNGHFRIGTESQWRLLIFIDLTIFETAMAEGAGWGRPRGRLVEDDPEPPAPAQRARRPATREEKVAALCNDVERGWNRYQRAVGVAYKLAWFSPVPWVENPATGAPEGLFRSYRTAVFPTAQSAASFDERRKEIADLLAADPTASPVDRSILYRADVVALSEGRDVSESTTLTPDATLDEIIVTLCQFSRQCADWAFKAEGVISRELERRTAMQNRAVLIDLSHGSGNPGRSWHRNPFVGSHNGGSDGSTPQTLAAAFGPVKVPGYPAWDLSEPSNSSRQTCVYNRPLKCIGLELVGEICAHLPAIDRRNLCAAIGISPSIFFGGFQDTTTYAIAGLAKTAVQMRPARESATLGAPYEVTFYTISADPVDTFLQFADGQPAGGWSGDIKQWPGATRVDTCVVPIHTISKPEGSKALVSNLFLFVYEPGTPQTQLIFNAINPATGSYRGKNAPPFTTQRMIELCKLGLGLHITFELPPGARIVSPHDVDYRACRFVKITGGTRIACEGEPYAAPVHWIKLSMLPDNAQDISSRKFVTTIESGTGRNHGCNAKIVGAIPGIPEPFFATDIPIKRRVFPRSPDDGVLFADGPRLHGPPLRPIPMDTNKPVWGMFRGFGRLLGSFLVFGGGSLSRTHQTACLFSVAQNAVLVWSPGQKCFLELPPAIQELKIATSACVVSERRAPRISISPCGNVLQLKKLNEHNKGEIVVTWQLKSCKKKKVRKEGDSDDSKLPEPPETILPVGFQAGNYDYLEVIDPLAAEAIRAFFATPSQATAEGAISIITRQQRPFYRLDGRGWALFTEEATRTAYLAGLVMQTDWELIDTVVGFNPRTGLSLVVSPPMRPSGDGLGRVLDLSYRGVSRYGYRAAAPNPSL